MLKRSRKEDQLYALEKKNFLSILYSYSTPYFYSRIKNKLDSTYNEEYKDLLNLTKIKTSSSERLFIE
jgi:hypothetical protein